jgi:pimeloyl-ACP methyl ester carboxylesterase
MADGAAEAWLDDAAEAMAVGSVLGDRVVLLGTSTGATLAAWAASRPEADQRLAAVVLLAPNLQPVDRSSRILLWPWGEQLARLVVGPERCFEPVSSAQERHWTTCYPTSALLPMMALVEHVRTMPLAGVEAPVLVVYSRRDQVVDATETERVFAAIPNVELVPFEDASDPSGHVLAGEIMSPGSTDEVLAIVLDFLNRAGVAGAGLAPSPAGDVGAGTR